MRGGAARLVHEHVGAGRELLDLGAHAGVAGDHDDARRASRCGTRRPPAPARGARRRRAPGLARRRWSRRPSGEVGTSNGSEHRPRSVARRRARTRRARSSSYGSSMRRTKRAATPSGATTTSGPERHELLLDPPGHGDVGQAHHVVAVHVGEEHRGERVRRRAGVHQPHDGRAAGVELQRDVAVADEHAGAGGARPGVAARRCRSRITSVAAVTRTGSGSCRCPRSRSRGPGRAAGTAAAGG